jgi:hypothetical protein
MAYALTQGALLIADANVVAAKWQRYTPVITGTKAEHIPGRDRVDLIVSTDGALLVTQHQLPCLGVATDGCSASERGARAVEIPRLKIYSFPIHIFHLISLSYLAASAADACGMRNRMHPIRLLVQKRFLLEVYFTTKWHNVKENSHFLSNNSQFFVFCKRKERAEARSFVC